MADIGDLLLFRGVNVGAKITRGLTQSKFGKFMPRSQKFIDHVAMVLRFDAEHKEVFFFDSTSNVVKMVWLIIKL